MTASQRIYEQLGVSPVINAAGTKTRIGGTRIREEALDAMTVAAESFVRISDLQAAASKRIAAATGAEAGYVTNGASSALTLAAAACIAGDDLAAMAQLPDTTELPDEIIMPRTHRQGYDHALRAAGATIVDVGGNDRRLGVGSEDTTAWELAAGITDQTVAVGYTARANTEPPLADVCAVAHDHDVPVIVDAAAELPPRENLHRFIEDGADLVAFSGGKAIRGPQSSGILAGRADLITSVARQHLDMHANAPVWDPPVALLDPESMPGVPRQGIGRSMKVGKEEIVGLLVALELFIAEDEERRYETWHRRAAGIADRLEDLSGIHPELIPDPDEQRPPTVTVTVDPEAAGMSASDLVWQLRRLDPPVFVGADDIAAGRCSINPHGLTDEEAERVTERFEDVLNVA